MTGINLTIHTKIESNKKIGNFVLNLIGVSNQMYLDNIKGFNFFILYFKIELIKITLYFSLPDAIFGRRYQKSNQYSRHLRYWDNQPNTNNKLYF